MFCTTHPLLRIILRHPRWWQFFPAKRTNKGRFYRAKAFIRNNNAADRLTASWFAIEKQENERNVRDPKVCSGFSLRGRRVIELNVLAEALDGGCEACGQLSPTVLTKQCLARDRYFIYVIQTPSVKRRIFVEQKRPQYRNTGTTRGHGRPFFDVNTKFAAEFRFCCV